MAKQGKNVQKLDVQPLDNVRLISRVRRMTIVWWLIKVSIWRGRASIQKTTTTVEAGDAR